MRSQFDIPFRTRLIATAFAFVTLPAWAQQTAPGEQDRSSNAIPEAISPPAPAPLPAPTTPEQNTETAQQVNEDAQLPAYLQDNPAAEANSKAYDPWEHYNRGVYRFNKRMDRAFIKPVALAYIRHVPQPVRNRVTDFRQNLFQPVTAVNLILQGHPGRAGKSLGRFAINSTVGLAGLFDPATRMHVSSYNEDFGQTLGRWGWRRSRYFLVPFFGPGTLRDRFGALADAQLGIYGYFHPAALRYGVIGTVLVDTRVRIMPLEELSAGIDDDYVLVREAWSQRRMHQIDDQTSSITDELPSTH